MHKPNQVFYTEKPTRWNSFKWSFRVVFFVLAFLGAVAGLAIFRSSSTTLPGLDNITQNKNSNIISKIPDIIRKQAKERDSKKFIKPVKRYLPSALDTQFAFHSTVRAGFYVNWDAASLKSLRRNADKMNIVFPEWFFIGKDDDTVHTDIDTAALAVMRQHNLPIVPMLSNYLDDGFNGENINRIMQSPEARFKLIKDLAKTLKENDFQGVNIDFEELNLKVDETLITFMQELYTELHKDTLIVTQDVMAYDEDYNLPELSKYNDYIVLMAYDEHNSSSAPGPISTMQWVEQSIEKLPSSIPKQKIILGLAGYGYDWQEGKDAEDVSYNEVMNAALESNATIEFDNDDYNLNFVYYDDNDQKHKVYFTDAVTSYNIMRTADDYNVGGVALWRLGGEDQRLWQFYNRNLSYDSLKAHPINLAAMEEVAANPEVDFQGEGEILDIESKPEKGVIKLEYDTADQLIAEQIYKKLPTSYVIKKYGRLKDKDLILSFDDGPDPKYTNDILDILKQENVPAAFFVIGQNAESNIPLLKKIYEGGYEIGNHTFTHPNLAQVGEARAKIELNATRRLIEAITGSTTILFRPPYNADAEPTTFEDLEPIAFSKGENYLTVGESIDPRDWEKDITVQTIVQRTIEQAAKSGIILLHDGGGNRSATVAALPIIIHYFKQHGYRFISIAQLMGKTKADLMPKVTTKRDTALMDVNGVVATIVYWGIHGIYAFFFFAIILSVGRTIFIAILASIQKRKAVRNPVPPLSTNPLPKVSIIVPAYNEEVNVVKSLQNLLLCDYPNIEIVFVNDGSKDNTINLVRATFSTQPKLQIHDIPNGGKAAALNFGINHCSGTICVCIDADTQLRPNAVSTMLGYFTDEEVGAVAGNVKVGNEINMLTRWQSIEYITSQNFDRRAFDLLNCITVVPGAIGAFRKQAIIDAGMFTTDTLAEDCDLTIRIIASGWKVRNAENALAYTEVPETRQMFFKQRLRWGYGIMQSIWKNKYAFLNPNYKALGLIALPNIVLFQMLLPLFSPLADIALLFGILTGHFAAMLWFYLVFTIVDALGALLAFSFEKEKIGKLWLLLPQRLIYRQYMFYVTLSSWLAALKGELRHWGVLKRTGNVKM